MILKHYHRIRSNLLGDTNTLKPKIQPHCNSKVRYSFVLFSQLFTLIYSQSQLFQSEMLTSNMLHVLVSFKFITIQKY